MGKQFREHLASTLALTIERTLAEYEDITYSEVIGVLETLKLEYFFEYLEEKKDGEEEIRIGGLGETPKIPDGSGEGCDDSEGDVPPTEPDSPTPTSST